MLGGLSEIPCLALAMSHRSKGYGKYKQLLSYSLNIIICDF